MLRNTTAHDSSGNFMGKNPLQECPLVVGLSWWLSGKISFPYSSAGKESFCNVGDLGFIPGLGRPPGEGNGNPLQYTCLENPMDRRAWWATVHGVARVGDDLATKPPPKDNYPDGRSL